MMTKDDESECWRDPFIPSNRLKLSDHRGICLIYVNRSLLLSLFPLLAMMISILRLTDWNIQYFDEDYYAAFLLSGMERVLCFTMIIFSVLILSSRVPE